MILKDWLDIKYTVEEQYNLTYLNCSVKGITSLEGIEGLVKLEKLYCYVNNLTSFSCASLKGIEHLVNLEVLSCSDNKLISLKGIEQLTNLKVLYCYNNKLTSLKEIYNFTKLKHLRCHNNPLPYSDLENLDKIKLELKKEVRKEKINKMLLL